MCCTIVSWSLTRLDVKLWVLLLTVQTVSASHLHCHILWLQEERAEALIYIMWANTRVIVPVDNSFKSKVDKLMTLIAVYKPVASCSNSNIHYHTSTIVQSALITTLHFLAELSLLIYVQYTIYIILKAIECQYEILRDLRQRVGMFAMCEEQALILKYLSTQRL